MNNKGGVRKALHDALVSADAMGGLSAMDRVVLEQLRAGALDRIIASCGLEDIRTQDGLDIVEDWLPM